MTPPAAGPLPGTLTPAELRPLFPAALRMAYLNAGAASPIALPVEAAIAAHYREAVEHGDVGFRSWLARKEDVRGALAGLLHAGREEVGFLPSTSIGFHVVGSLLKQLGVTEVVTLAGEFPSTTLPLLNVGLTLRVVQPRPDGSYALEDVAAALRPTTGALVCSAVQYASGFRMDLAGAAKLCRDRKLHFAVNASQALGQLPIDVAATGIDFLCAASHKWALGGFGVGMFFARKALLEQTRPPFGGWLSVATPMAMDNLVGATRLSEGGALTASGVELRHDAGALEAGGMAWGPLFGLGAGLALLEGVGLARIEAHNARLQALLRGRLRAAGFRPNAPDDRVAGICVFPVEGRPDEAARALHHQGVSLTPRGGGLRASTHVYNTEEDVERLLAALGTLGVRPAPP